MQIRLDESFVFGFEKNNRTFGFSKTILSFNLCKSVFEAIKYEEKNKFELSLHMKEELVFKFLTVLARENQTFLLMNGNFSFKLSK